MVFLVISIAGSSDCSGFVAKEEVIMREIYSKFGVIPKILGIAVLFVSFSEPSLANLPKPNEIQQILQQHVDADQNVGAIVSMVTPNADFSFAVGRTSLSDTIKPQQDTLFEIGSISKVFTGLLLAHLVLENKASLADPVSKFFPELKGLPTGPITLMELSTHTSGLPRLPTNLWIQDPLDPYYAYQIGDLFKFLKTFPLGKRPTEFSWDNYSNVGVGLLGYVLTRISGKTYAELLRDVITQPLQMNDTVIRLNSDQSVRFAKPYNSALVEVKPWLLPDAFVGSGGIRSTQADMTKFLRAAMNPTASPLARAFKLSQQVHASSDKGSIGLGWAIDRNHEGQTRILSHSGGTGGYKSFIGFNAKKGIGFVSLTNTSSGLQCLEEILLWRGVCEPNFGLALPGNILDSYQGVYERENFATPDLELRIFRKRSLLIYEIVGQEMGRLRAVSETKFEVPGIAIFSFVTDTSGAVSGLRIEQGGRVFSFRKN